MHQPSCRRPFRIDIDGAVHTPVVFLDGLGIIAIDAADVQRCPMGFTDAAAASEDAMRQARPTFMAIVGQAGLTDSLQGRFPPVDPWPQPHEH